MASSEQRPSIAAVPGNIRVACGLMVAGAVFQMVHGAAVLAQYVSSKGMTDPKTVAHAVVFLGLIAICGYTALWIWMAVKCRSGRNWARVTSTVFFAIQVLGLFVPIDAGFSTNTLTHVIGAFILVIGLVIVVLLWTGESSRHFGG